MTTNENRSGALELAISRVLRYGVVTAFSLVALGCLLMFSEGQTGYHEPLVETQLIDGRNTTTLGVFSVLQGVLLLKPYAVIYLGVLVLLATPVIRVAITMPLFAMQRRLAFVLISGLVFAILLVSIFVVAPSLSSS